MTLDRPRVAKLATDFLSGSETFIFHEVNSHVRYDAEVLTLRRQNSRRFPVHIPVHALAPDRGVLGEVESALCRMTSLSPTFFRIFQQRRYDLIHAHFGPAGAYALPYRWFARKPLVVTFHGHEVPLLASSRRFHPKHWGYWALSRWLLKKAERLLAVSPELKDTLIQLGAPAHRVHLFHLGIPLSPKPHRLPRREKPLRILMVGRLVEKKGFEYGIAAFAKALTLGMEGRLMVVGEGPTRRSLERLIASLGISQHVTLRGDLSPKEVQLEYRLADVLLCPSVVAKNGNREGTPTVIKEASAEAIPTIGTLHGGIPQLIVHEHSGFLVPERDIDGMAAYLHRIFVKPDLGYRMGLAAREHVEATFNLSKQMLVLESHYDAVIAETRIRKKS